MRDIALSDTFDFKFTTRQFSTGAPFTLAGTPAISIYEDNSLTQITAGITLTVDFDSVTGLNNVRVVATGANGFEAGKSYSAVITTGTVDSVSVVGEVVYQFTIEAAAAAQRIGAAGAGLTAIPWNASWDAEVQSEANDALVALGLDHMVSASVTGTDVANDSIIARLVDNAATADWDNYDNTAQSLKGIRVRGDAAWTTGGGGSITDLLNIVPVYPRAVDLANTASYRIGFRLTNALDDLPSAAEITPGTVQIYRKALGGTTWANPTGYSGAQACSEVAGMIYFDIVFSTANGFAAGDMLRFDFLSQQITVSANDYQIVDGTNPATFYSGIVAVNPGVDIQLVNGEPDGIPEFQLLLESLSAGGALQSGSFADSFLTAAKINDGAITGAKIGALSNANFGADVFDAANFAADVAVEFQSGMATSAEIAALDVVVDRVEADTQNIQSRLPAALSAGGFIMADMEAINGVAMVGDGSATPFTV